MDNNLGWVSSVVDLEWLDKPIPPLPEPEGSVVRVSNLGQLYNAVREAEPHTTILIEEGTYQLVTSLILDKEGLVLRGASNDRSKVVLLGNGFHGERGFGPGEAITIDNVDITVANLTIQECRVHGIAVQGHNGAHRARIYNVAFIDTGERGIKVNTKTEDDFPHSEGGIVEYCLFEQTQPVDPNRQDGFGGNYVSGIAALGVKDWIIRDNVFVNIRGTTYGGEAILVWVSSTGTIIERNLIIGSNRGIAIGNWHNANRENYWHHKGGIVRNNVIYVPDHIAGTSGIEIVKVLDLKVYNNTVFHADPNAERVFEYLHPDTTVQIKNNLVRGDIKSREGGAAELAGNITQAPADWFRDPEKGDMRLTEKAAEAAGSGLTLEDASDDFYGVTRTGANDPGAFQYR